MQVFITPAVPGDGPDLERLVNSAYRGDSSRQGWTTEADLLDGTRTDSTLIEALIKKQGTTILKYVEDGEILGCVELAREAEGLYLGMLTVHPRLQGKGIGKALLTAAESEAKNNDCPKIFMTVISVRAELIAWYVRHGYTDTGKKKPFDATDPRLGYPKRTLEFTVLEKKLR